MMGVIMINDNMVSWFISMMNINVLNSIIMFVNDNSLLIMGVINVMNNGLWSSLVMYDDMLGWGSVVNDNVLGWLSVVDDNVFGWSGVVNDGGFWSGVVNNDVLSWSSVVDDSSLWLSGTNMVNS